LSPSSYKKKAKRKAWFSLVAGQLDFGYSQGVKMGGFGTKSASTIHYRLLGENATNATAL